MANYVLNDEKMFCDIADGIAIVINSETGIYYGMNNFGTNVFESILNGVSSEDIFAAIKQLPDAPEDMPGRLEIFIQALLDKELIRTSCDAAKAGSVNLEAAIVKNDSFTLVVNEYDDAQELLLADPIHEVKPETGWQPEKEALNPDVEDAAKRESKMKNDK